MDIADKTQTLLQALGFDAETPEQRQIVLQKLQEMVDLEILYATTSRLTDNQIEELDAVTAGDFTSDDAKGQAIVAKLKEFLPDYEEIVARALDDLYTQIRADVDSASTFLAHNPPKIAQQPTTGHANPIDAG